MSFKSFMLKKMILWDKIPTYLRWKKSVSGIGVLYVGILEMVQQKYGNDGVANINEVMYNIGLRQSTEILEMLDLEKDLEGCAYVLLTMHRMFGIRSKVVHNDNNRIVIHATRCQWGGHIPKWNAGTCMSIDHYEAGLIEGIMPHSKHEYTQRRSCGYGTCELVITL